MKPGTGAAGDSNEQHRQQHETVRGLEALECRQMDFAPTHNDAERARDQRGIEKVSAQLARGCSNSHIGTTDATQQ